MNDWEDEFGSVECGNDFSHAMDAVRQLSNQPERSKREDAKVVKPFPDELNWCNPTTW